MRRDASAISENTKVKIGFAFTVGTGVASLVIAVLVADARTEVKLESLEKRSDYRRDDADKIKAEVTQIKQDVAYIRGWIESRQRK